MPMSAADAAAPGDHAVSAAPGFGAPGFAAPGFAAPGFGTPGASVPMPRSNAQRAALAAIVSAAENGKSFAAITGEAATGKTSVLDMAAALLGRPPIQVIRVTAAGEPLTSKRLVAQIVEADPAAETGSEEGADAGADEGAAIERALDRLLTPDRRTGARSS